MSLLGSLGKVVSSAGLAVAKTAARAVTVVPLIAANVVAKDAPIVKKATSLYDSKNAIKDAGTTLSVASLAAGGVAAGSAYKAGSSILSGKVISAAATGVTGSILTTAPKASEKAISSIPKAVEKAVNLAGENPTAAIAALSALPVAAYAATKAAPAAISLVSNLTGNEESGVLGKTDLIESVPILQPAEVKPLKSSAGTSSALLPPTATESKSMTPTTKMTPILAKKPYKRRKPKEPIRVSQRVVIGIKNSNTQKVYKQANFIK